MDISISNLTTALRENLGYNFLFMLSKQVAKTRETHLQKKNKKPVHVY
jgi:hypothetical protein